MVADPQHRLRGQLALDPHAKRQGATQACQEPAGQTLAQRHQVMPNHPLEQADDAGQQGAKGDYQGQMKEAQGQTQFGH